MKKIIFLLSLGIWLFSSCLDILDTYPKDSVNSATFWKSKNDVDLALAGCYKHLKSSTYLSQLRPYLDGMTDNGYCWQTTHSTLSEIQTGILNAMTGGVVSNIYNGMYKGVTACYIFLENFEAKKDGLNYSENESNCIIAEVRFLRAYYLFELVQRFGGVVIYDKVPSVLDSKIAQRTKDESLQYIIADLDFAIENLPDEIYSGHVVRNTAKGLRARVALFMNDWETVKDLTSDIINAESSGKVAFAEAYDPIFIKRLGQVDCREILFAVEYLSPDVTQNLGIEIEGFYYSGLTPFESFVSSYEKGDKRVDNWYYKAVNGAYLRPTDNTMFMPTNTTKTGYGCVKFFDRMNPDKYLLNEYDIKTDDDVVLMRFTEIMLMYAEAMVELGNGETNDQIALECINRIRKGQVFLYLKKP